MTIPYTLDVVGEDAFEVFDLLPQVLVLPLDLLPLQRGEPLQPEVEDRLRLALGELEGLHQVVARRLDAAAERRMVATTSSRFESAMSSPSRMCARALARSSS